jgi:DNA mismatch endonuclease (patch repair protein)
MTDVHSKETRSYNMSRIRSKDTKPEMLARSFLHSAGFRYKLHDKNLPGKPDIVLPKYNTIIFVHGCFWHSHKRCSNNRIPSTNKSFWVPKLIKNANRDAANKKQLRKENWKVIIIWECSIKKNPDKTLLQVLKRLKPI